MSKGARRFSPWLRCVFLAVMLAVLPACRASIGTPTSPTESPVPLDMGAPRADTALDPRAAATRVAARRLAATPTPSPHALTSPRSVAVGPDGAVYVTDVLGQDDVRLSPIDGTIGRMFRYQIVRIDPQGGAAVIATPRPGLFYESRYEPSRSVSPADLATDTQGWVYHTDPANRVVRRLLARPSVVEGAFVAAAAELSLLAGVAVDRAGNVYLADRHAVRKLSPDGTNLWEVEGLGQLNYPHGIAVADDGAVYVADTLNHRLLRIDQVGRGTEVALLAGTGRPGSADGIASAAEFNRPYGLALAPDGRLYVADLGNRRIRAVDRAGAVGTVSFDGVEYLPSGLVEPRTTLDEPVGVAVGADGAVYVADMGFAGLIRLRPNAR